MANIFDLFKQIEKERGAVAPITHIIAGLGNPDSEYSHTRHNAGFDAIDLFAEKNGIKITKSKFEALTAEITVSGKRVLLMKPQTYMNLSGTAVKKAADFYKIPPENVIVICDDINLDVGKLRVRRKGSDGGQKGLRDIIKQLGTDEFPRVRVGVGRLPAGGDIISWVLGRLPSEQRPLFAEAISCMPTLLPLLVEGNIEKAMCDFN